MLLHYTETGQGQPIVLLHGMAASTRFWDNLTPSLAANHRVIALDLLGFGRSPKPKQVTYGYETHIASILETLDQLKLAYPAVFVGHSMGSLLALRLAFLHPHKVSKLVLLALPYYNSPSEAKQSITKNTRRRLLAYYGPTSHVLCSTWCKFLRPISKHVAPAYLKSLPKAVAKDSVLHSWQSYAQSLDNVIAHQTVKRDLNKINIPVHIIYGDKEDPIIRQNLRSLDGTAVNVHITKVGGGHNIGAYTDSAIINAALN
ncbi:MAG TPA: alpha/beta hydrolase [Candidatus Saccharimonadales bacterium]|nr:alpha/beta hydrolase [Candidatus Saccharimonadales bacterium]